MPGGVSWGGSVEKPRRFVRQLSSRIKPGQSRRANFGEDEYSDGDAPPPPPPDSPSNALPPGWRAISDKATGRTYYAGPGGQVSWTAPATEGAPPPPAPPPPQEPKKAEKSEVDRNGKLQSAGRLEFPNSRRPMSKWVRMNPVPELPSKVEQVQAKDGSYRVGATEGLSAQEINSAEHVIELREQAMRKLVKHALEKWHLMKPSVLISVNGGAGTLDLTPKQSAVFRHGLLDAARQASGGGDEDQVKTTAWIFSGGTDSGVMSLAGKMFHGTEPDDGPVIPLIGVASWGVVSQRAHMDPRAVPGASEREHHSRRKNAGRYLYNSKTDPDSQVQRAKESVALEPNHSNFIFVDDGTEGQKAFSRETDIRSAFEDFIARGAPTGDGKTSLFGEDEDGERFPDPPMVVLVVGGGPGTFKMVVAHLLKKRPVVVIADTGGAAADIYSYCIGEFDPETACTGKLAMEYLPGIKELGEVEVGVRKAKMLTFFHLSSDYSEHGNDVLDLSTQILNAILSDCETTGAAIEHAVRWRNATVIRKQLTVSQESDPQGIAHAFQNALLGKDRSVIKVLIQYNVDVQFVSVHALVQRKKSTTNAVPYTWGDEKIGGGKIAQAWVQMFKRRQDLLNEAIAGELEDGPKKKRWRSTAHVTPEYGDSGTPIRFTDAEKLQPMPRQIRNWVEEDNKKRREENTKGQKKGEWSQEELDDLECRKKLREKDEHRSYQEIMDEMKRMKSFDDEYELGSLRTYPAPKFLKTDWSDLMFWAVCKGEVDIAELLWEKTREPLRFAIWAAQIAGHLARYKNTSNEQEAWMNMAETYEDWAVKLLEQCPTEDHELAAKMLCITHEPYGREQSAMDDATDPIATSKMYKLISAPHTRSLVIQAFDGDFPGSNIRVAPKTKEVTWAEIALQILVFLFLLPFPIVDLETRENLEGDDEAGGGFVSKTDIRIDEDALLQRGATQSLGDHVIKNRVDGPSDSDDDDWEDYDEATDGVSGSSSGAHPKRKLSRTQKTQARTRSRDRQTGGAVRGNWTCLKKDHCGIRTPFMPLWRLALFLRIPRVVFFVRFVFYTAYVLLFVYSRVGFYTAAPWMRERGTLKIDLTIADYVLFIWSLMRFLEEFQPLILVYKGWDMADVWSDYIGAWQKNLIEIINVTSLVATTGARLLIGSMGSDEVTIQAIQFEYKTTLSLIQFVDAIQMILLFFSYVKDQLSVFRSVGVLWISLKKMGPGILTWFALILP